jgi:transposase
MPVVSPVCCGLDVHQAQRTACLRCVSPEGQRTLERRECGPTSGALLALSDWRAAHDGPVVALESTGVYWRPVSHVLVGTVAVLGGNARDIRPRPGTKTDTAAAAWIAALLAPGLIRPSVVPPPAISA